MSTVRICRSQNTYRNASSNGVKNCVIKNAAKMDGKRQKLISKTNLKERVLKPRKVYTSLEAIEKRSFFLKIFIFLITNWSTVSFSLLWQKLKKFDHFTQTFRDHGLNAWQRPVPIIPWLMKEQNRGKFENRTLVRRLKWRLATEAVKW